MINNDRGNTLITVLLASLVFTVLGMAIVASSLGGAKKTETRESDISLTYDAIKLVDQMTSDLAKVLEDKQLDLEKYRSKSNQTITVDSSFDTKLKEELLEKLIMPNKNNEVLECINIIDLSEEGDTRYIDSENACLGALSGYHSFNIDKRDDFTRVFDIVLVTKNPIKTEGKISRTITKRLILSPLPSFLKYAAGADGNLILNGSPNFAGNVYANHLTLNNEAEYQLRDEKDTQKINTPKSSINGDLYSRTANLLSILEEKNFYKGKVPILKHDSQFINIEFDKTMIESTNEVLADSDLETKTIVNSFSEDLKTEIKDFPIESEFINNCTIPNEDMKNIDEGNGSQLNPLSIIDKSVDPVSISCINSDNEWFKITKPLKVNGDLIITSTNHPIDLEKNLVVDGDLYVVSNKDITIKDNVYVTGETHVINFGGQLTLEKNLISADTITITSEFHADNESGIAAATTTLNGDIIGANEIFIKPINSAIEINKNIFAYDDLSIMGDDELGTSKENDEVIFDSVVYAGKNAYISNVNISGADNNKKQLILLAKEELLITRINEFKNFKPLKENGAPYLPIDDNDIQPLKGFFYTEDQAELYGVGSLFYIDGGIFAKKSLTINAIRGEVEDITDLPHLQEDYFSRFIVNYDQDVLLKRIEALPIVDQLQIFSDELIVK
ncbi:hypothetical protein ACFYKT_11180 [Cytobacillus sp. FJAT-53684]|uniref:Type II secretion system protein n=1 Tax=Cytobacillus mangrovibacter TaxID=3299024 RepID=A0ABW6JYB0_9BACI